MKALALALATLLAAGAWAPMAGAAPANLEWWGAKALDQGFHMRVPVTVANPHAFPVTNAPVAVDLDLAQMLVQAGWTKSSGGDRDLIAGFHLDPASIRVVAMTNLQAPDAVNGRLKVADPTYPSGDDRRFEVPSLWLEGSLQGQSDFEPSVNPHITVLWRVADTLRPAETRSFVVYFDSDRTAQPKAPRGPAATLADGDLQSLFWSGPTLEAFGYVQPPAGAAGRIQVTALHADTTFNVSIAPVGAAGTPAAPLRPLPGGNTFHLATAESTLPVTVSTSGPVVVLVRSDKPVIAQGTSMGFVPAVDGGLTGRDFLFATTTPLQQQQDVLYVKAVDPRDDDGSLEPTTVEVTPLPGGEPLAFHTGDSTNPFDYAATARAGIDATAPGCWGEQPSPPITDNKPSHPRLFRAHVTAGEQVMLQLLPVGGLTQVPSALGAPTGVDFWAAGPWSTIIPSGSGCRVGTVPSSWLAAASTAGTANVTTPELGYQLSPPGAPSPPGPASGRYPAPQPVPAAPAFSSVATLARRVATDRPVQYRATTDSWLFAGTHPAQLEGGGTGGTVPQAHGPLGGADAGRHFAGLGRSIVYAPFTGTTLGVQAQFAQGTEAKAVAVAAGGYTILDDRSASDPLRSFSLDASRPVVVNPAGPLSSGFFAGVPAMLSATPEAAQYRGYLIDLSSEDGLDPLTRSTAPGTPVETKVVLSNRGRGIDGGLLPDLVRVAAGVPDGWTATLDGHPLGPDQGPTFSLAGGASRQLTLVITPPEGLPSGSSSSVRLTASSLNNEMVQDALDAVVYVKTVHAVGAWFDVVDGPKDQENRTMSPEGEAGFWIVVQNRGSRAETIHLETRFKLGETTWAARLGGPDGGPQMDLELGALGCRQGSRPCDQARVPLALQAPPGLVDGEATAVVLAQVVGVAGAQDAVQATAARRAPSDLSLEVDGLTRAVLPGGVAVFNVTLRNRGAGDANVLLSARASPSLAWSPPVVLVAGQPRTDIGVDKDGGVVRMQVQVPSKAGALQGQGTTVRFSARAEGGSGDLEAILYGVVRAVHRLDTTLPGLPVAAVAGGNTTVDVRLGNRGNLDETLDVRASDLPARWSLRGPDNVRLARGGNATLHLNVSVPAGWPAGAANASIDLVSRDGNVTRIDLPMEVALGTRPVAEPAEGRPSQPGRPLRVEVPVANDGNVPVTASVARAAGEAWPLADSLPLLLMPGEHTTLPVSWLVPADAPDGASSHRALLTFRGTGVPDRSEPVIVRTEVARPDLGLQDVGSVRSPGGVLVHAVVANLGKRPASAFTVALMVDGQVADQVEVGAVMPGQTVDLSFLQTSAGRAVIAIDAAQDVVESDEGNNQAAVTAMAAHASPAAGLVLLVGLLALASVTRRRRP